MEAKNKTKPTRASVEGYLKKIPDGRREDCQTVHRLMKKASRARGVMWGPAILGYGSRRLVYESGRAQDVPWVAFASRKDNIVLYVDAQDHPAILKRLGKHKLTGCCLYIKRLTDVRLPVLEELIRKAVARSRDA